LPCQMVALRPFTVSLDSIFAFRKASGHDATGHDARGKKGHRGYMPYSKHIDWYIYVPQKIYEYIYICEWPYMTVYIYMYIYMCIYIYRITYIYMIIHI
jgi:hypothetical protein